MGRIVTSLLLAGVLACSCTGQALAQTSAFPSALQNTVWTGKENLFGQWTELSFALMAGNQAVMVTPQGKTQGTWQQLGTQVVLQFPNIKTVFTGTLNGNTLSGQGQDNLGSWSFSVTKLANNPPPVAPLPVAPAPANLASKASIYGKYSTLLKIVNVPEDQASYGTYYDYGYWSGSSWKGYQNLPQGYWVYVYPNWYIWGQKHK
jgi:hypothetical protein